MREIALIASTLAAFFPLTTGAASAASSAPVQSERSLREECSYEITGFRECLEKKQKLSENNLKSAEKHVRDALSKWDEDAKYIALAKTSLAASEKAFAKYREDQCAFAASLGGGAIGNALDVRRLACAAELNNRRAEQLRNAVTDLPLK